MAWTTIILWEYEYVAVATIKPDQQHIKIEVLSLAKVQTLTRRLARQIQESGFEPDIVITIARGGFVPARLLCDYLDIYNLASIRIAHYTGTDKGEAARLSIPLNVDIQGMSVLLVDDIDDTGETLKLALTHLQSFTPACIRIAVLHHKTVSSVIPDFYASRITRWRWVTYPWAITEDMLGLVKKMRPPPTDIHTAITRIAHDYKINISKTVMEDVFRLLQL